MNETSDDIEQAKEALRAEFRVIPGGAG